MLSFPTGALLGALRAGQEFASNIVRDGLVHVDNGSYREALIAVDEEQLVPVPEGNQSMKLTNQQVARAGEHLVAAEIHLRGGYAATYSGNMP